MKRRSARASAAPALILVALLGAGASRLSACTGIRLVTGDGSIIRARTMEFGKPMGSDLIVVPRGWRFSAADGDPMGLSWTGKYGFAGASVLGRPLVADGVNEKGLSVGMFYFPGSARYVAPAPEHAGKALASWDVATYLLSRCATAAEAAEALRNIPVVAVKFGEWGIVPPLHYQVCDAEGRTLVVEHAARGVTFHDDALGVLTNSPGFDWHMTNLRNYIGLEAVDEAPVKVGDLTAAPLSMGSGLRGLPGDFTSPSRFVRAIAFTRSALPVKTADEGVAQAFHILNQFDIPPGSVRAREDGREVPDVTQWTGAADCTHRRYFMRTRSNSRIRLIDLDRSDLDAKVIRTISLGGPESFEDVTPGKG